MHEVINVRFSLKLIALYGGTFLTVACMEDLN